jgi:hypothetical protein
MSVISNLRRELSHPSGHQVVHWSMDKGFRPAVQISMHSNTPSRTVVPRVSWRWIGGTLMGLILAGTWLMLLFSVLSMDAEFRLMKQALMQLEMNRQPPPAPSWAPPPPIIQTVTTTVFVSPTPHDSLTREAKPTSSSVSPIEPSPSPTSSTSVVDIPYVMSTSTSLPVTSVIDIRQPESTTTSHTSPLQRVAGKVDNALAPLYQLPLTWNLHFDLPPVAEETVETVMRGLHKTWEILRKIYHYPLPPPT